VATAVSLSVSRLSDTSSERSASSTSEKGREAVEVEALRQQGGLALRLHRLARSSRRRSCSRAWSTRALDLLEREQQRPLSGRALLLPRVLHLDVREDPPAGEDRPLTLGPSVPKPLPPASCATSSLRSPTEPTR
jgi:hypothetical protein